MKKLILFLILAFTISIVEAKPHPKKQRHQNRIFQKYVQCSVKGKGTYSWSFRPKAQTIFFNLF